MPPPRPRLARGEGERLREEILDAAERLLVDTGDEDAVSVRAIARAVGVAPPSIYLHFADKAELVFEVCERHFRALDEATQAAAAEGATPFDSLRRRGEAYIRFGLDNPEHYRILLMGKTSATPSVWHADRLVEAAAFAHLLEDVERSIVSGELRAGTDPAMAAVGLWMSVHGMVALMIAKPTFPWPPVDALIDHLLGVHAFGLAADDGGAGVDGPGGERV